jgi:hypothetical protein
MYISKKSIIMEEKDDLKIVEDIDPEVIKHASETITTLSYNLQEATNSLEFYKEFVKWMTNESIGDIRKNLEAIIDNQNMSFKGYVEVDKYIKGNNIYLSFYLDDKEYNAIWQPVDNYAVIQWTTFEDDYYGYMLFPTSNDKRYFCMYYEC